MYLHKILFISLTVARVQISFPANFDPKLKYPVLVDVYAGPGDQGVSEKFVDRLFVPLNTEKEYIDVKIDGRGTSGQGLKHLHQMYRKLGQNEIDDQIYVMK